MNATVNSSLLAQELRLINKVVTGKSPLPILSNVWLHAQGEALYFYGTDLEVGFSTQCRATVALPGTITLPAKKLLDLIEQLPNADVQLTLDKAHVRIASGSFKSRLQSYPADSFPPPPDREGDIVSFPPNTLHSLIEKTRYAISDKTSKYIVNAALLSLVENGVAMVATDGKRLSIATRTVPNTVTANATIPSKTLDVLAQLFADEPIEYSSSDKHLFFVAGDRTLVSRMIDGAFPSYKKIIPTDNDKRIVIDRAAFAAALRRVGMVSEDNKAVQMFIEAGSMSLATSSTIIGDAFERVPIQYEGELLKLTTSWQYLLDFLDNASGTTVTIEGKNSSSPLLLTDGSDYVGVVMTMRDRVRLGLLFLPLPQTL